MTVVRNTPTPEGYELGKVLAKIADKGESAMLAQQGTAPYRCVTCAFRKDTFPNGCVETVMDALKCVMEGDAFYCHHSPKNERGERNRLCAGWIMATSLVAEASVPRLPTPWKFSHEYTDEGK